MKMKLNIIDNTYAYSIYLVPGLLAWTSFSTIVMRLNSSIFEKSHLIKKINVPMYVFQLSIVITEFALLILSMSLALIFLLLVNHPITWAFLWMLPIMVLQTLFAFGLGVILSLFTPFFRDLREAIPIVVQLWFWMTPIIYMKEMIASKYPALLTYNPFFYYVEIYQDIFLFSKAPALSSLAITTTFAFISLFIAGLLYKKMISSIKDII